MLAKFRLVSLSDSKWNDSNHDCVEDEESDDPTSFEYHILLQGMKNAYFQTKLCTTLDDQPLGANMDLQSRLEIVLIPFSRILSLFLLIRTFFKNFEMFGNIWSLHILQYTQSKPVHNVHAIRL